MSSFTNPISSFVAEISLGKIIKRSDFLSRDEAEQQFQDYLGRPGWYVLTMDFNTALTLRHVGLLTDGNLRWQKNTTAGDTSGPSAS